MDEYQIYFDRSELGIKGTAKTPFVWFMETGQVYITGRSIPEDAGEFYFRIWDWVREDFEGYHPLLRIYIRIDFLNGISAKYLLQVLLELKKHCNEIKVTWHYHDDQPYMLELGEMISACTQTAFEFVCSE